jgi:hypothetical protein
MYSVTTRARPQEDPGCEGLAAPPPERPPKKKGSGCSIQ